MKKNFTLLLTVSLAVIFIISQTGCSEKPVEKTSYYMDTVCQITIYDMEDMSEENASKVIDEAFVLCADYEALLSYTKEDSDIAKINRAGGAPVNCDPRTVEVIKMGLKYGELSDGLFDITYGRVMELWDFHEEAPTVPTESEIAAAMAGAGYEQVKIDGCTVSLGDANAHLNLGGIGKGYIADRAAEMLSQRGVTSAVLNFGGNIITIGDKDGEDFNIGIQKPFGQGGEIIGSVPVSDGTVVTSGIYERSFEKDGKLYHHILDVETGYPKDTDVAGVTLIGGIGSSADCDAMSTICLLLGVEKGKEFIERMDGVEAVFVDRDGKITKTDGAGSFKEAE